MLAHTNRFSYVLIAALLAFCSGASSEEASDEIDYGNHNLRWEDGPSSWEEFGHGNDPDVCGLAVLTVEEWEAGRYWEGPRPVLVRNVTAGWAALHNWKKEEMLRRYPDAEATMGEARLVGQTGPDAAGSALTLTTVKEFITKHMYDATKYFFDRKIAIPKGMLEDCHPFPMPTRAYIENPDIGATYGMSKKKKVRRTGDDELWRDHLAISIGADLQGLTFHHHDAAWNTVIFGHKRWILWDRDRHEEGRLRFLTRDPVTKELLPSHEWIRRLYPHPERVAEIRAHGHDCIQGPGEMMFVPAGWRHMVVNVGDTVSVISELGLGAGDGKKPEDFEYDPDVYDPTGARAVFDVIFVAILAFLLGANPAAVAAFVERIPLGIIAIAAALFAIFVHFSFKAFKNVFERTIKTEGSKMTIRKTEESKIERTIQKTEGSKRKKQHKKKKQQ